MQILTALRWPIRKGKDMEEESSRSPQLPPGLEDFVDIEKMLATDLATDLDFTLPTPKLQNQGNGGNEEKKVEVEKLRDVKDVCVINIAPNVSKDAWDLLNEIEGDLEYDTHRIVSTNEALSSLKHEDDELCCLIPNTVSDELVMSCISDREILIKHEDTTMEVPVWPPIPDPVLLFDGVQECKPDIGMENTHFLSNIDLPTDVNTPDVDLSFLTNHTLELLPTPALCETLRSVENSGLNQLGKTETKNETEANVVQNIPQIGTDPTTPTAVAGILRLNTGSEVNLATGKGAALQLRRQGGKRQLDVGLPKIEVKHVNNEQSSDGSTTTIIITLTDSNTSPTTTNVRCVTNEEADEEAPLKKAKLGEKYIDMRRKNNEASRRSRQTRKEREQEMAKVAEKLTRENAELQQKVTALEKLRDSVKAELMKVLSGGK